MQNDKKSSGTKEDPVKEAAKLAEKDMSKDPDLQPDQSKAADLDEGELAQLDNSND